MKNIFFFNHDLLAKASVNVLYDNAIISNEKFKSLFDAKEKILKDNKGSVVVSNSMEYFLMNLTEHNLEKESQEKKIKIQKHLTDKVKEVSRIASKKIKNNSEVFIHSANNQIFEILSHTAKYKKFRVHILEHQPHELGRYLVKKLEAEKIDYKLYPDLAMESAIASSDICLVGAEAILEDAGAIVKSGTRIVSKIAKNHDCPVYICAHSWRFDYKGYANHLLEYKYGENHPTYIYEHIPSEMIDSYITEHGIFKPEHTISEIKYFNKWMRL